MGITIHQSPTGYTSAHEEVWHVVESSDKDIQGFKYIYDIYKDGQLLTRVKNSPLGVEKLGVIDVGNIVRSALDTYNFPQLTTNFASDVQLGADVFFTNYDIQYGQMNATGDFTGNIASGNYRVYNNYKRSRWDKTQSDISGTVNAWNSRLLTNRPIYNNFYEGEPIVLSMFVDDTNDKFIRILYIDDQAGIPTTYESSGLYNNAFAFSWIPSGTTNIVRISKTRIVDGFEDYEFKRKCSKYEPHTLVFLNAYGVYDSFTFIHGKMNMSNERKKFEQMRWGLSNNRMTESNGSVYNETMKTYANTYKEKMILTSDILSTGEYNWLSELINSPQVYYYSSENAEYYPVQITESDYEFKDDRIEKAETLRITIHFGTTQNTQYR
jgi:hypothetical protein